MSMNHGAYSFAKGYFFVVTTFYLLMQGMYALIYRGNWWLYCKQFLLIIADWVLYDNKEWAP